MPSDILVGAIRHVLILISMILTEVKKAMAAMIGGFEVMAKKCIGCDEDYATEAFLCVGCLVTCSSDLDKMGWQHL
jgi:hypothetical protein